MCWVQRFLYKFSFLLACYTNYVAIKYVNGWPNINQYQIYIHRYWSDEYMCPIKFSVLLRKQITHFRVTHKRHMNGRDFVMDEKSYFISLLLGLLYGNWTYMKSWWQVSCNAVCMFVSRKKQHLYKQGIKLWVLYHDSVSWIRRKRHTNTRTHTFICLMNGIHYYYICMQRRYKIPWMALLCFDILPCFWPWRLSEADTFKLLMIIRDR